MPLPETVPSVMQRLKDLPHSTRGRVAAAGLVAAGMGLVLTVYSMIKPFVLAAGFGRVVPPDPKIDRKSPLKLQQDQKRHQWLMSYVVNQYIRQGDGVIQWPEVADIVDLVARINNNDKDFREDVWYLFGWDKAGRRTPLAPYLDKYNRGLPQKFHNCAYNGRILYLDEQMHHYLGGATGNTSWIPSHLQNSFVYGPVYELQETLKVGHYNVGDVRLFSVARKHRDDFLRRGRFVVGPNIRKMLAGREN